MNVHGQGLETGIERDVAVETAVLQQFLQEVKMIDKSLLVVAYLHGIFLWRAYIIMGYAGALQVLLLFPRLSLLINLIDIATKQADGDVLPKLHVLPKILEVQVCLWYSELIPGRMSHQVLEVFHPKLHIVPTALRLHLLQSEEHFRPVYPMQMFGCQLYDMAICIIRSLHILASQ